MPIQFRCSCGQILAAQDNSGGKKAKCPKCGALTTIPSGGDASATQPQSRETSSQLNPGGPVAKPVTRPAQPIARPVAAKPATALSANPVNANPAHPKPVGAQPVASKPVGSKPSMAQPVARPVLPTKAKIAQQSGSQPGEHSGATVPDPLSVELPAPALNPFAAPALKHKKKSNGAKIWTKVAIGISCLVIVGLALVCLQLLSGGGSGEIEASFKPVNISPEQKSNRATATGSLKIANDFIAFAKNNDAQGALNLVDRDAFRKRVRSERGSYEAMRNRISIDQLLDNLDNYSLEKVEADNGRRRWQILGTSEFRGDEGVVVRYYVEGKPASDVFRDRDRLLQIVELLEFDQFMKHAQHIFAAQAYKHSSHDSYRLSAHAINAINPPRVGYLLLVVDNVNGAEKLVEIVNILGQTPYSQTCGKVYLDDYHIHGLRGETEVFGTESIQLAHRPLQAALALLQAIKRLGTKPRLLPTLGQKRSIVSVLGGSKGLTACSCKIHPNWTQLANNFESTFQAIKELSWQQWCTVCKVQIRRATSFYRQGSRRLAGSFSIHGRIHFSSIAKQSQLGKQTIAI